MLRPSRFLVLIPLLLVAAPAAGQESPDVERLEHLRFERLQEALELNEEQVQALRSNIEEFRRQSRESREAHRESMERLRQALESDDEAGVEEALTDLERRRLEARERQSRHEERLAELLRPEQRARFLLFHDRFDSHLRELIHRHRRVGPGGPDGTARQGNRAPVVPHGDRTRHLERRHENLSPEDREREIESLRSRIERMQRQLEELERQGD
ncbi:MAG: Spy/CpxP family protein refolding chaperone [Gemmatimonadota bacterium]